MNASEYHIHMYHVVVPYSHGLLQAGTVWQRTGLLVSFCYVKCIARCFSLRFPIFSAFLLL